MLDTIKLPKRHNGIERDGVIITYVDFIRHTKNGMIRLILVKHDGIAKQLVRFWVQPNSPIVLSSYVNKPC